MITKENKNKLPKLPERKQYIYRFVCKNVLRDIDSFEDILIFDFIRAMGWGINPDGSCFKVNLWGEIEILKHFNDIYFEYGDNSYKLEDWNADYLFILIKQLEGIYYE